MVGVIPGEAEKCKVPNGFHPFSRSESLPVVRIRFRVARSDDRSRNDAPPVSVHVDIIPVFNRGMEDKEQAVVLLRRA